MAFRKSNYWLKEIDRENDLDFIILCFPGRSEGYHDFEAWITPSQGSNLCRLLVDGVPVIDFDRNLIKVDFTGTPVLYPTPNRVREGILHYQGKEYTQVKRGIPVLEHGLVYNEPWNYTQPVAEENSITLTTWIDFIPGQPIFEAFPFPHKLSLNFRLNSSGLKITYTIENQGSEEIPFGFGLHPYFMKVDGEEQTFVTIPANCVMEATQDLLPTGRLNDVAGNSYDLRTPVPIGTLNLDHVYTRVPPGQIAKVLYRSTGLSVSLNASQDFSHLVLYSPTGMNFFCLENQTCSTDAHNLYARGFHEESGLKFVKPGQTHTGSVVYEFHEVP